MLSADLPKDNDIDDLKLRIKHVITKFKNLLVNIENKKGSTKRTALWNIRADLELITVEIKYFYNLNEQPYDWQLEFKKEKGTANETKAITKLKAFKKGPSTVLKLFEKDILECYKYLWKLKETISITIEAFPYPKWEIREGKLVKQSEKIFKI